MYLKNNFDLDNKSEETCLSTTYIFGSTHFVSIKKKKNATPWLKFFLRLHGTYARQNFERCEKLNVHSYHLFFY